MATASSDEILQAIKGRGYWTVQDAAVGKHAHSALTPRIDLQTVEALRLFQSSTVDHTQNAAIINATFNEPVAVFFRGFGRTKRTHCFENNVPAATMTKPMLGLCLCAKGTKIVLYDYSYRYELNAANAPNGVLAISEERLAELTKDGHIIREEKELEDGGYILHDGRLLWQVLQGKAAFVGILDPDGAQGWKARMPLPRSEESENIIQQIRKKSRSFCNHFTWV